MFSVTSNLTATALSDKDRRKQKLIIQFAYNLRDESFKPSYFMIGQLLSNTNESSTVPESKFFWQLNNSFARPKSIIR